MIIDHYMPSPNSYAFGNLNSGTPYLRIAARTNNDKQYVLRIEMPNYPNQKPDAYVECTLHDRYGNILAENSLPNHTLAYHPEYGWTQICHYHPSAWRANMTLWMVYVRCVMWLNIYEQTLRTGEKMDTYLRHMGKDGSTTR